MAEPVENVSDTFYLLAPAIRSKIYCNSLIKGLALVWLSYIHVCVDQSSCGSHFELVKLRLINEYVDTYVKVENRGWEPMGLISVLCRWRVSVAVFLHSQVRWGLVESQLLWGYSSQPERGEMHHPGLCLRWSIWLGVLFTRNGRKVREMDPWIHSSPHLCSWGLIITERLRSRYTWLKWASIE